jgi:GNAT superfamily N-acetyltransferase
LNRFTAIIGCAREREVKSAGHRFVSSKTHGPFDTTKLLLGAASVNPLSVVDAHAFLAASGPHALAPLFEGCANRCHCRYWHFVGTKNEWLEKCAFRPEENASELSAAIGAEADDGHGIVALSDGIPVGWLKVAPRTSVPKLRNQGVYKRLELANEGVWVVVCLLVAEEGRRKGIARALIGAVDDYVRRRGGHAVEALPRVEERELHAEEAFAGPWVLYRDAGFEEVAGERPYSVFRKRL